MIVEESGGRWTSERAEKLWKVLPRNRFKWSAGTIFPNSAFNGFFVTSAGYAAVSWRRIKYRFTRYNGKRRTRGVFVERRRRASRYNEERRKESRRIS